MQVAVLGYTIQSNTIELLAFNSTVLSDTLDTQHKIVLGSSLLKRISNSNNNFSDLKFQNISIHKILKKCKNLRQLAVQFSSAQCRMCRSQIDPKNCSYSKIHNLRECSIAQYCAVFPLECRTQNAPQTSQISERLTAFTVFT